MKLLLTFRCSRKRSSHTLNNWIKIQIVKGFWEPVGTKYIEGSACEYGYSFLGTLLSFALAQNYANAKTTHTHTWKVKLPTCYISRCAEVTISHALHEYGLRPQQASSFSYTFLSLCSTPSHSLSHSLLACSFIVFLLFYGLHSWACSSWLRGVIQMHDKFKLVCHLVVSCGRINLNVLRIRYLKC